MAQRSFVFSAIALAVLFVFGLAQKVQAATILQDVRPGEYFSVEFQFTGVPFSDSVGADVFMANGGSVSHGLLNSKVYLYADNQLIGTFLNDMLNTFAMFKTPESPYQIWAVSADLEGLFHGAQGRIEFHPMFDALAIDPFVNYQLVFLGAMQSSSPNTLIDDLVSPVVSSASLHAVPLPPALPLILMALGAITLFKRRQEWSQY